VNEKELQDYIRTHFPEENGACEWKEFKNLRHAVSGREREDVISYVSALANMDGGCLVIGVKDKTLDIVGIQNRNDYTRNNIRQRVMGNTQNLNSEGFRCQEFITSDTKKTVWVLHIPSHKPRLPVYAHGKAWQRIDESIVEMTPERLDAILRESVQTLDWSAVHIPTATIKDLDKTALAEARDKFKARNINQPWCADFDSWSNRKFLDRAKLTINGIQTRASILLLGKPAAAHFLSPHPAQITWYLADNKKDYLHVDPPFFLNTTRILEKINARNSPQKLFPKNQLLPVEVIKFETEGILEALHNCIVYQDYERQSRIVVIEYPDRLVFENAGGFFQGAAEDYFKGNLTPDRYRNPWLANAMHEIRMIDTMGIGISTMTNLQRARYLPLPDYSRSTEASVTLEVLGRPIDERYSQLLLERQDLDIDTVILLDRVQKKLPITDDAIRRLRRAGLVEGRKPNYHVSASVAVAAEGEVDYTRRKGINNAQLKELIGSHVAKFPGCGRSSLNQLVLPLLSSSLSSEQKKNKVTNTLKSMKNRDRSIYSVGRGTAAKWFPNADADQ